MKVHRMSMLGRRRNVLIRVARLGACDVLRGIDIPSFRRISVGSVDVTYSVPSTSHIVAFAFVFIDKLLSRLQYLVLVIGLRFTSIVQFNSNNALFRPTDCLTEDALLVSTQ